MSASWLLSLNNKTIGLGQGLQRIEHGSPAWVQPILKHSVSIGTGTATSAHISLHDTR